MISKYQIDLPAFSGPLDLLLHLIERQELDITAISLAHVTDQYLLQIEQLKEDRMEQLIDFLVVAARLVLIKSRALLPQTPVVIEGEEEEDPAEALIRQLRQYKLFKQAAKWFEQREEQGLRTYLRVAPPPKMEGRLDLSGVSVETLLTAVQSALARVDSREGSVAIVQPRRITIEGQINKLRYRVKNGRSLTFRNLLSADATRVEISISLLAVLELIKRREITAVQPEMFGPIELRAFAPGTD
ncbi:MAG: segregation/condensation protein A [Anaerolineales bacterium]|nr:segregation/condensation protein A [Anaerolineales bacterium]MCA9928175.1 segregation/condensation protein A [Anaerolineales bacterium]